MLESFRALVNGGEDWAVMWSVPNPVLLTGLMAVTAVAAYFLGCSNGAILVSKYILRDDVRSHGSGNAGLTNFFRTFGGPLTLVVILSDVVKAILAVGFGLLAVWLTGWPGLSLEVKYWAGLFCLLGHMFPCMFGFQGGKGILSGGTIAWLIDWRLALLVWGGFALLTALTRYVSLGSVYAAAFFPVGTWLFVSHDPIVMTLSILLGGLILWKHRGNIQRLLKGEENKLSFHKKKE
ncbi:MAG: glycerol-3-phosphate acyltransferase [Oscillospiraceae bacterium]|jgi:glycerol-3-phosphate acyltransferase PlsY|uniref:glycerol-3-phosphate acyltransferase n=1 Tax=Candidatus Pseudoscillospira sp. SGI.172 TaxID=3420582 RepID=UPI002A7E388D|nr:glycerol-3-phosphate acyltransferase [Pseudoflavonifractor sp.]MDY3018888.1 glycerol-3-phosphate acyltransferase [Oscillospiraceae bacterium]